MPREKKNLQERFWSKVDKKEDDKCWEWTAYRNEFGYGRFMIDGTPYYAHRLSYILCVGEIPVGMYICHQCNNPACVNPRHLRVDTPTGNARQTWDSGHGINQHVGSSWRTITRGNKINRRGTLEERFWRNVIAGRQDECWNWLGHFDSGGYGMMRDGKERGGKQEKAHRISYRIHFGEIPEGMWILHKCDHKWCVNPNHLFVGTRQDNVDDMCSKGRNYIATGEKCWRAKLTWGKVREIRRLYSTGQYTYFTLSDLFHVAWQTIGHVVGGRTWKE